MIIITVTEVATIYLFHKRYTDMKKMNTEATNNLIISYNTIKNI